MKNIKDIKNVRSTKEKSHNSIKRFHDSIERIYVICYVVLTTVAKNIFKKIISFIKNLFITLRYYFHTSKFFIKIFYTNKKYDFKNFRREKIPEYIFKLKVFFIGICFALQMFWMTSSSFIKKILFIIKKYFYFTECFFIKLYRKFLNSKFFLTCKSIYEKRYVQDFVQEHYALLFIILSIVLVFSIKTISQNYYNKELETESIEETIIDYGTLQTGIQNFNESKNLNITAEQYDNIIREIDDMVRISLREHPSFRKSIGSEARYITNYSTFTFEYDNLSDVLNRNNIGKFENDFISFRNSIKQIWLKHKIDTNVTLIVVDTNTPGRNIFVIDDNTTWNIFDFYEREY